MFAIKNGKIILEDGIELDKVLLVGGSTRIPAVQEKVHALTGISSDCISISKMKQ